MNPANAVPNGEEQQNTIVNSLIPPETLELICQGYQNLIPEGTQIVKYEVVQNNSIGTVTLKPATHLISGADYSVSFTRPVTDYVSSVMLSLWYSWAKYYIDHTQLGSEQKYSGNLTSDRVLTFKNPVLGNTLVPGMKVTGNGIPDDSDGSFCTITALSLDDNKQIQSVTLSELVKIGSSDTYKFNGALPIAGFDHPLVQILNLSFEDADTAMLFSQAVYQAMSAISTIPPDPKDPSPPPVPMRVLYNVIGCNVGQIPNIGQPSDNRIGSEITDKIKSVLRGVPDFQKYPESTGLWYPDPSASTGGCNFNVYNLDPFVWFVHQKLGLSGYGFSVDDDVADVGANNATNLAIAIGGLNELPTSKQ